MTEGEKPDWVEQSAEDRPSRSELLRLYEIFQTRQIADLDMVQRYANYYFVGLMAAVAAFFAGLNTMSDKPFAGLLVILPVVSFVLSQQGKLMTFRFYRRYNEGRMRLTKIEYLLGLHDRVRWSGAVRLEYSLWPKDTAFELGRYVNESQKEAGSCEFIQRRSYVPRCWRACASDNSDLFRVVPALKGVAFGLWNLLRASRAGGAPHGTSEGSSRYPPSRYGIAYVIHTTFTVFSGLFVLAIVGLPLILRTLGADCGGWWSDGLNVTWSAMGLAFIWVYMRWYSRTLSEMEHEAAMRCDNSSVPPKS